MSFERNRPRRSPVRLAIEGLEGRVVPATFHAANVAQLVADITKLSNANAPNTIVMAPGTYVLTQELQIANANNLTILGRPSNPSLVNIVGQYPNRTMEIDGGSVTLSGITVSGGGSSSQGGGILARNASLTLQKSTVDGNSAAQIGGGIFMDGGALSLVSSTISGNSAGGGTAGQGGGIAASNAQITIKDSAISGNTATASSADTSATVGAAASGGGIYTLGGTLDIRGTKLTGNTVSAFTSGALALANGGALAVTGTNVTIQTSGFQDNTLSNFSAQTGSSMGTVFSARNSNLTITSSTISANNPSGWSQFDSAGSSVTIRHSRIDGRALTGTYAMANSTFTKI